MAFACNVGEPVVINVSSNDTIQDQRRIGIIQEVDGKRMTLLVDEEVAESAAIQVQTNDLLSLGTVLSCIEQPESKWLVRVQVNNRIMIV